MKGRTGLGLAGLNHSSDGGVQGLSLAVWYQALGDSGQGDIGMGREGRCRGWCGEQAPGDINKHVWPVVCSVINGSPTDK